TWPPHKEGESAAYLVINRNKRDITLDLKSAEGVEVLTTLVSRSDVLIENFRTGTMESFGLGYETLAAVNPRLIYCSISAFGRTGPRADGAGYEALMQAFSGIMSITGEPDGPPVRCGVSFLDLTTGILCAFGVVNALLHRERTGLGQRLDASLLETAVALLNYHAEGYLLTGAVPRALGSSHPSLSPYRNFRCRDGQWVFIAGANDRFWQRLVPALGLAWMATDPRFASNIERVRHRKELEAELEQAIATHEREPLLGILEEAGVPATPVNTVDQVMQDPQTAARELIERVVHPRLGAIPVVGTPVKFSGMRPGVRACGRVFARRLRSRASTPTRCSPSTATVPAGSPSSAPGKSSCRRADHGTPRDPEPRGEDGRALGEAGAPAPDARGRHDRPLLEHEGGRRRR